MSLSRSDPGNIEPLERTPGTRTRARAETALRDGRGGFRGDGYRAARCALRPGELGPGGAGEPATVVVIIVGRSCAGRMKSGVVLTTPPVTNDVYV